MLKPDRHIFLTDVNFVFNGTADSGTLLVYQQGTGSGNGVQDDKAGTVAIGPLSCSGNITAGSGVVGLLVNPFVTFNPLLHRNWYKVTQWPGEKATLLRQGWVNTNIVATGVPVPDCGVPAYLGPLGVPTGNPVGAGQLIGEFQSRLDENGFCRLAINLPHN